MFKKLINSWFRKPAQIIEPSVQIVEPIDILQAIPAQPLTSEEIEQHIEALQKQIEEYSNLLKEAETNEFEQFKKNRPAFYSALKNAGVKLPLAWDAETKAKHAKYAEDYVQRSIDYTSRVTDYSTWSVQDIKELRYKTIPILKNYLKDKEGIVYPGDPSNKVRNIIKNAQHFEIFLDHSDSKLVTAYTIINKVRYDFTDEKFRTNFLTFVERGIYPEFSDQPYKLWQDLDKDPNYDPSWTIDKSRGETLWFSKNKTKVKSKKKIIKKK